MFFPDGSYQELMSTVKLWVVHALLQLLMSTQYTGSFTNSLILSITLGCLSDILNPCLTIISVQVLYVEVPVMLMVVPIQ